MKTCNKCGKRGLYWNKEYFEKNGKWKLSDHRNKDGEWCIKSNFIKKEFKQTSKKDCILCPLCTESNFGLCRSEKQYELHKKVHHPNGETLTDLDYHAPFISKYTIKTFYKSDPHYLKYV